MTAKSDAFPWGAHLALLAVGIIYSLNYFIAKALFAEIPPLGMVAIRTLATYIILRIVHGIWVGQKVRETKDLLRLAVCGLFGAALNQGFFFKGLSLTVEVNASVLMTTSPLFVFIVAFLLRSEPLTPLKVAGLLVSFCGAALLSLGGRALSLGEDTLLGDLMILTNAASYGIYLVLVRPLLLRYHFLTIVMWVFFFGSLINVPMGIPDLLGVEWATVSTGAYLRAAYIVLFVTVGTYTLNGWALKQVSAASVGVYIYLQPVLVACLSIFWGTRPISGSQVFYMLMVLLGVYAVTYRKKTAETTGLLE